MSSRPDTTESPSDMRLENAVAFYGTLRPGEPNHWLVRDIPGTWVAGVVRGYLFEVTWGRYEGYTGFIADPDGHKVPVAVLVSDDWASHVDKVDEFEGPGYERRPVTVLAADGTSVIGESGVYEFLTDH